MSTDMIQQMNLEEYVTTLERRIENQRRIIGYNEQYIESLETACREIRDLANRLAEEAEQHVNSRAHRPG